MLTECNCLVKYQCLQLRAKYYLFLKQGITCSANNCKDLVSGKSGNHTVKYVTPIFKYLFISLMIVSGVPAVTKLESPPLPTQIEAVYSSIRYQHPLQL